MTPASEANVLGERQHLMNLSYRMLGTVSDAEDAVQETYARWFRMTDGERADIRSPQAWLTRVAANVCLDVLGSARHRREEYVGEWLPEPVSTSVDPLDQAALADSVTMALLVVLESLSPAERVAFVLHDVFAMSFDEIAEIVGRTPQACRKLASTARRHIDERRQREATVERHGAVVQEFWTACATGDFTALLLLLDPDVVTLVDGGGKVTAALKPIRGADRVSRFLFGVLAKAEGVDTRLEVVHGRTAVVFSQQEIVTAVVSFDVLDDRVAALWIVMTPDKLHSWN